MNDVKSDAEYIQTLIQRAKVAQREIENATQRKVDEVAAAIIYTVSRPELAEVIAKMAFDETGMGKIESKIGKMSEKLPAILYDILPQKTVGVIEEIPEKGLIKIAKPVGVIAAIIPATNPEATPVFKGVLALRGRNAIIFSPSRRSYETTNFVVNIMRQIARENGLPEDLFICVEGSNTARSNELMQQSDLIMATGSGKMVKAAYSSGKPALGVGAGNAVVIVDETADLEETAKKIYTGKTGDNASGCSAENSLIIEDSIYDDFINALENNKGYLTTQDEKERIQNCLWIDGKLNPKLVARPASVIAEAADINLPDNAEFLIVEEEDGGKGYPFSQEKMSVVLTLYRYKTLDDALALLNRIQANSGYGHSCGIHSNNNENIMKVALNTHTVKVLVRQPHGAGNSGNWFNGLANTFSLGCGTWGGNSVSENITQKHYINTTWLSYPIERKKASDEEIYQDLLENVTLPSIGVKPIQ